MHNRVTRAIAVSMMLAGVSRAQAPAPPPAPAGAATVGFMHATHATNVVEKTLSFIRKLKRLGLTESYEVGYGISPRGKRFLSLSTAKRSRGR